MISGIDHTSMKTSKFRAFFQINFGAFIVSFLLACIGGQIVLILLSVPALLIKILYPSVTDVILAIFVIIAFVGLIISWILIFKKSYKYFDISFSELQKPKPTRKQTLQMILIVVFVLILSIFLFRWLEKLAR